ncbi:exodeoxyribonuclease 7 large subunit [Caldovatus sediminis]|uniref:Exodeoxyribonuclease 7 large subunit n=1 Tax=Caldovatus sediminis TaxID=2041189 RepID=A0A8J3EBA3_9PROT|nr:exodeoxyribonuclease VII large subunit [Caldovatus sediminis]GGG21116.1 exodeoxyribonuclease 7 large subunit [Caldovatus sediminis]
MDSLPRESHPPTNTPEYAVSEIAGAIKRTLEGAFGRVRVRGEITELKRYHSGHVYLSLKDEWARLEAVVWKTRVPQLGLVPENGLEVIATGRISTYPDRSRYQLVVERMEYAGTGALLARIEKLRQRLLAEGLFDEARKVPLPRLPEVIGVVTSPQGAVIQDIRTTIARRFPRRILLWPVAVQGAGAAEQIAAAIRGMDALPAGGPIPRPDVLIVARGGGSLEDLMAFNEEVVVRAAAACSIPLISAVGHETDTTLLDFAADRRAPTPTAAAEMAVPARADLLADLAHTAARLQQAAAHALNGARLRLLGAERRLPDVPGRVQQARQRLDDRAERLDRAAAALLRARRETLAPLRVPHPREAIAARRAALGLLRTRIEAAWRRRHEAWKCERALVSFSDAPVRALIRERRTALAGMAARLEGVSYQAVLARGFALVRGEAGEPVTRAAQVAAGQRLALGFADGTVDAVAAGGAPRPLRDRRATSSPREPRQGALL